MNRKMLLLLAASTTLLIGCEPAERPALDPTDWQHAAETHTCSVEQRAYVERETVFCATNTTYMSSYCYSTAIMRNCDRIEPERPFSSNAAVSGTEPRDDGSRMGGTAVDDAPVLNAADNF